MDCIVLAGGQVTEEDPLHAYLGGKPKALIEVGGRTLLERVLAALGEARSVQGMVVAGLEPPSEIRESFPVDWLPDQGSIMSNGAAGIDWLLKRKPDTKAILICTADIPTISGTIVDDLVSACRPFDRMGYYFMVERETMEARFPAVKRTYSRLDGSDVCGCDMVVVQPRIAAANRRLFDAMENARKQPWKMARIVGARFLAGFLLGRLTMREVEDTAARLLGGPVRLSLSDHAELAMDVDKPQHLKILRGEFEQGARPA